MIATLFFDGNAWAQDIIPEEQLGGMIVQPQLSEKGFWDSNPQLSTTNIQQLYGSITSPELIVTDQTPTHALKADTRLDENIFNLKGYSSTDVHSVDSFTNKNQNWGAGITGQIDYDTTRTSEVSIYGLNTLPVRHLGLSASPQISYNPLPTDKLALTGSVQTSQYQTSVFTDYDVVSVSPSYSHDFDPLNTGVFSLSAQRYQTTKGPSTTTDTFGPSVGWTTTLTPQLTAHATVGPQWMRQSQFGNSSQSPWMQQYIFSTDLAFLDEQDKLDITATRSSYPFGNATESLLTNIGATDKHVLNKNFSLDVGASYEYASYQVKSSGDLDTLASANGGLTYHMTEHLDVTGTYQYRYETLINVSKGADDHSVTFGLVYHPQAWAL